MRDHPSGVNKLNSSTLYFAFKGISWKILAFACYAMLNALARYLSGGAATNLAQPLPVPVIVFFQDLFALVILAPWILKQLSLIRNTQYISLHLTRVILSALGVISWYFALWFIPQGEAVALSVIGPMLGVLGAKLFLKEKISLQRASIILFTFGAAIYLMRPIDVFLANQNNSLGLLCVLVSTVGFALAKLATRKLASEGESVQKLTIYLLLLIVPISFIPAIFVWTTPSFGHLPWLILAGLLTVLAIYSVSKALSYSEVSFLAPFDFIRIIFNFFIGYLAFTELPHPWVFWVVIAALMFSVSSLPLKRFKNKE